MAIARKKLVFVGSFANASADAERVFPCTQFRSSYTGDLWGNVLQDLQPLTVGSPGPIKQLNDVTAWARLISAGGGAGTASLRLEVDFTQATTDAGASLALDTTGIKTKNPVTGAATTLGIKGVTPILTRHFAVRLTKRGSAATTCTVAVYVQRQHSIEA